VDVAVEVVPKERMRETGACKICFAAHATWNGAANSSAGSWTGSFADIGECSGSSKERAG
jgi:hypothetical protein